MLSRLIDELQRIHENNGDMPVIFSSRGEYDESAEFFDSTDVRIEPLQASRWSSIVAFYPKKSCEPDDLCSTRKERNDLYHRLETTPSHELTGKDLNSREQIAAQDLEDENLVECEYDQDQFTVRLASRDGRA